MVSSLSPTQRAGVGLAVYFALAAIVVSIVFPVLVYESQQRLDGDRASSEDSARRLVATFNTNLQQMRHAMHLTIGFVMAAAPLKAPRYFVTNASQRQADALKFGNPNAMGEEAYERLSRIIARRLPYVNQIGIAPGFVNWRSNSSFHNVDLYAFRAYEFDWMAANISESVPPPLSYYLYYRTAIFTVPREQLNHDPRAIDPATGHHPNFAYIWGSVTTGIDAGLTFAATKPLEVIGNDRRAFLFAKAQVYNGNVWQPQTLLGATAGATGNETADNTPGLVEECITDSLFNFLCIRVWPVTPAGTISAADLGTAAALCIILPAVLVFAVCGAVQCRMNHNAAKSLQHLPQEPPFFVVSLDLCDASQLWTEIPHAAATAVKTLGIHAAAAAAEDELYVAQTVGSNIIAIGTNPKRVLHFARAMIIWALRGADLPPEIIGLFPDSRVALSAILHHTTAATIHRSTSEAGVETANVLCEDFWLLMSMRGAAVPHNIIATSAFIAAAMAPAASPSNDVSFRTSQSGGEVRNARPHDSVGPHAALNDSSNYAASGVKRLGECCAQPRLNAPPIDVEGFLVRLHPHTNLDDVYDRIPEHVMIEWRRNLPPAAPLAGFNESAAGASAARVLSRTGATEMFLLGENDAEVRYPAPPSVPGCAVEYHDARKIVGALLDLGAGGAKLNKSVSHSASTPRRMSSVNEQAYALRPLTSLASYQLSALRILFAPLDAETRQTVVSRICAAVGVPMSDESLVYIAARCASLGYEEFAPTASPASSPKLGMPSQSPDPEELDERRSPVEHHVEPPAENPLRGF